MKNFLAAIVFVGMLGVAVVVHAVDLQSARQQNLVGETQGGYIAPIGNASPEVSALVADVNAKRKAEYERISSGNGQPVSVVEKLAAEKIISGLPGGSSYQDASGSWVTK